MTIGRGGYRPGSGAPDPDEPKSTAQQDYDEEKARHEKIKADEREFKLSIIQGKNVDREAVRQATATLLSVLTQALRSVPDNLERTYSLDPVIVESVARQIDEALAETAVALEAMVPR